MAQVIKVPKEFRLAFMKAGFKTTQEFFDGFMQNFIDGNAFILKPNPKFIDKCKIEGRDPATVLETARDAYTKGKIKWETIKVG